MRFLTPRDLRTASRSVSKKPLNLCFGTTISPGSGASSSMMSAFQVGEVRGGGAASGGGRGGVGAANVAVVPPPIQRASWGVAQQRSAGRKWRIGHVHPEVDDL